MTAMNVLLVEDDARDIDLTRRALARAAPQISLRVAATLEEARACLAENTPCDLVLTDLTLPDGSGLQLVAEIRERAQPLAVVVLTGSGSAETALAALKAGADDFLVKRADYLQRLPAAIEAVLRRFQMETARRSRPLRVLYAEDSAVDVDLTRRHLQTHAPNIRLEAVSGVPELLQRLPRSAAETCRCDVLLLDYHLPGANAFEVLKILREERRLDLPVVLVTGQGDGELAAQAFRFGAAEYLIKNPGYLAELPAVLEAARDRAQLTREQAALRDSEALVRAVLDSLTAHVAVLDVQGTIISVNQAWRDFALRNGASAATCDAVGTSYLASCANVIAPGGEQTARHAHEGIQAVLDGRRERFSLEYPCNSPDEQRWFLMNVSRRIGPHGGVTVAHENITQRKLAETALQISEANLRAIADNASVGIRIGLDGRNVFSNRYMAQMLGYAEAELGKRGPEDVMHPDVLAQVTERLRRRMAGEEVPQEYESVVRRKDGRSVPVEMRGARTMWNGRPASMVFMSDISERKRTEEALHLLSTGIAHLRGEALFNQISEQVSRLVDAEIGFVAKLLGADEGRIRTIGLSVDGKAAPAIEYALAGTPCAAAIAGQGVVFADQVRQKFPAMRMLADLNAESYAAVPLFDAGGQPAGSIGVISRAPLRRPAQVESILRLFAVRAAAELEREEVERRFQDLFEYSPDASVIVNQAGRITLANRQAAAVFGYTQEELAGMSVDALLPPADKPGHARLRQQYFQKPTQRSMGAARADLHARRKDGTVFPADISLNPLHSDEGVLAVATVRDITAQREVEQRRKNLEAQLFQAQKMEAIGTLAGGIAHDFNNIVGAIIGNVELAREDVGADHPALQSLDEIRKASRRARDLVGQILAFSRQQPLSRQVVALAPLVEEVVKLLRATLPTGVELRMAFADAAPEVLADATQLHQILMNLCSNARHAMDGGRGRIDIQIEGVVLDEDASRIPAGLAPGRYACLTVRDSGRGMDAATRERIFEPFFTTKAAGEGTGLGLAVVHGIMQNHHGAITVDSQPGGGTRFHLYFPAADAPAATIDAETAPLPPPQGGGKQVLYLDDDEALVVMTMRLLERQGYRVAGYTDSAEALQALRADPGRFDLVVTDYNMPGMSGIEVARIRPDLPVALISGYITDELRGKAEECGVRNLIYKPNTVEELCAAVRNLTSGEP